MAHAKDTGAKDEHVIKKAQKSIEERRAQQKAKHGAASSSHSMLGSAGNETTSSDARLGPRPA